MANKFSKIFNGEKSKLFWLYIVVGALLTIAAVMLMPFWAMVAPDLFFANWGTSFVQIVIAGVVLLYLFGYLFKKVNKINNKTVKVLAIIECSILMLVVIGCVVSQFSAFALDASLVLAIALLLRGSVEVFRAYYHKGGEDNFPVIEVVFAIVLVALGGYLLSSAFITNQMILWFATVLVAVVGILVIIVGISKKPKTEKKPKKEKQPKEKKVKKEKKLNNF